MVLEVLTKGYCNGIDLSSLLQPPLIILFAAWKA